MELVKLSLKEKILKLRMRNMQSVEDLKSEFDYSQGKYNTDKFYMAVVTIIHLGLKNEKNQALIQARNIWITEDKYIFIVDNLMGFIEFAIIAINTTLTELYGVEHSHIWSYYIMCFPDIVAQTLTEAFYKVIFFSRYKILPPYNECIRGAKDDIDRMYNVILIIIMEVIKSKIGVIGDESNRENCLIKRKRSNS